MVPGNEDRDITADVDASDRGETMERLSLVILPDTNRTSLTATVMRDGDAAADVDASDLGQTMDRLPLMVMLLLLPLLYDVDRVSQTAENDQKSRYCSGCRCQRPGAGDGTTAHENSALHEEDQQGDMVVMNSTTTANSDASELEKLLRYLPWLMLYD